MVESSSNSRPMIQMQDLVSYRINGLANVILRSASRHFMAETGLHPPEIWVMCSIGIHEPITAREVAGHMAIDEAQVSRAIKSLIEQKYVHRKSSKEDNRRKLLNLSNDGKELYLRASRIAQDRQDKILSRLSEEDIETFTRILDVVSENAQDLLVRE